MKETILIFNLNDKERLLKLEMALFPLHVRLRRVFKDDYAKPLGYLAGQKEIPCPDTVYKGGELDGVMLVFAFLDDEKLSRVLAALRKSGAGSFPYKAVLTPVNQFWTPPECFEEIRREHEAMTGQDKDAAQRFSLQKDPEHI